MGNLKHEEQLQQIFSNVNEWLKFAEAKNFGLLSLNAAVIFGFSQTNFETGSIIEKTGFFVFLPFAVLSFFPTLISLFPIVSKIEKKNEKKEDKRIKKLINKLSNWIDSEASFENIHFYGYLKDLDESLFEAKFLEKVDSKDKFAKYEQELTTQILYNSRITWLKYQLFKIGAFLFFAGAILFVIALPIFKYLS